MGEKDSRNEIAKPDSTYNQHPVWYSKYNIIVSSAYFTSCTAHQQKASWPQAGFPRPYKNWLFQMGLETDPAVVGNKIKLARILFDWDLLLLDKIHHTIVSPQVPSIA